MDPASESRCGVLFFCMVCGTGFLKHIIIFRPWIYSGTGFLKRIIISRPCQYSGTGFLRGNDLSRPLCSHYFPNKDGNNLVFHSFPVLLSKICYKTGRDTGYFKGFPVLTRYHLRYHKLITQKTKKRRFIRTFFIKRATSYFSRQLPTKYHRR